MDTPTTAPSSVDGRTSKERRQDAHSNLDAAKSADSAKRFAFLLGQTDLFRHFIDLKASEDAEFAAEVAKATASKTSAKGKPATGAGRHRKSEKEEDAELLNDKDSDRTIFTESPPYVHGLLRDYQVQGLNWLVSLYENGINGILADEMGLGKTLQTISFLGYLRYFRSTPGPHLVLVPKSTMHNWSQEFKRWIPEINVLLLQGEKQERQELIKNELIDGDWDVCVTSYEMVIREKAVLRKFAWEYIVIDEAHRIKNEESLLSQVIRMFNSRNRLLITGTPLQNNMHELWALLNFLLPDVFSSSEAFDNWFSQQSADQDSVVQQLHKVLRPFLLRRVKADVEKSLLPKKEVNLYVGMSEMQHTWYKRLLEKDIDAVNGAGGKKEGKTRLLNICMQLRKCCNHPYLFDGAEPGPPFVTDEKLINDSGKMVLLDRLLQRMKAQGSRVLIFSQMSRLLDIMEDYCFLRQYEYCRIDGQTSHEDRISAIDEYNKPDSSKFLFLLTTRAGGLGINLTTADVVVLFDSDWNPQADLQAMDRAHRIGQTKQVYVYRFVTEGAIEEKILERAAQKLRLDQLVIQQGRAKVDKKESKDDLLSMVQHGAEQIFQRKGDSIGAADDNFFDEILKKGEERTAELNKKFEGVNVEDLQKFTSDNTYEWNGEDFTKRKQMTGQLWIHPSKRERKQEGYSIDAYYSKALKTGSHQQKAPPKERAPRPPRQIHIQDHQFYPARLAELQEQETAFFQKEQGYKVPGIEEDAQLGEEERAEEQARIEAEQARIDNAVALTEEEQQEKEELAQEGFGDWQRRDFHTFIRACERHGRNAYQAIAQEMETKTEEEVKTYAEVFFARYDEVDGHERYLQQIEAGEHRIAQSERQATLLKKKMALYKNPMMQMRLVYAQNKGKVYTEEEDRYLMVRLHHHGLAREDVYDLLRQDIRESPLFRFDWFIKSRTPAELQRRCQSLLNMIVKEMGDDRKRAKDEEESESETSEVLPKSKKRKGLNGQASGTSTPITKGKKKGAAALSAAGTRESTPKQQNKSKASSAAKQQAAEPEPVVELPPTLSGRVRKQARR
ncbi:SNF2 family N-terminal domain-domain-containing protein [Protomyces lactucae-debilis]|uniref:SNF2 family N-terminal domain-domain-containing protein n=1 Tax=Protomyces lactucae-debilis TaxID=2754530 RepID=A0A1Y2FIL3_PROLT|nr:SNF2 family N-terminal domain-containing protein [Protomyces lactucae-debilis]ORY83763.1 SNF2 family N-terminal domain-domain-containing protein [Protomyces lactucae-debilis]